MLCSVMRFVWTMDLKKLFFHEYNGIEKSIYEKTGDVWLLHGPLQRDVFSSLFKLKTPLKKFEFEVQ